MTWLLNLWRFGRCTGCNGLVPKRGPWYARSRVSAYCGKCRAPERRTVLYEVEEHDLDGKGNKPHEVYYVPIAGDYWAAVTNVPCPVKGCNQTVVWYEAGYTPGYRACMTPIGSGGFGFNRPADFNQSSIKHHFFAKGDAERPCLIRDEEPTSEPCPTCEGENRLTPTEAAEGYTCNVCCDESLGYK